MRVCKKKVEHLIDQIALKCTSTELGKKILTIGDSITLDEIITKAKALVVVNHKLEDYGNKNKIQEVNEISRKIISSSYKQES